MNADLLYNRRLWRNPGREHSGLELIRGLHNLRERHHGSVVTIGAFDGVHRGHQAVISDLLGRSREFGLPSTVILFEPLPREYFAPVRSPPRLMSFREKFMVLRLGLACLAGIAVYLGALALLFPVGRHSWRLVPSDKHKSG